MGIITLFLNFIRSIQLLWSCFLSFSLHSNRAQAFRDIEAGISASSRSSFDDTKDTNMDILEIGILDGMSLPDTTSDRSQSLTLELPESPILSRVSTFRPVKTRIVDAIMKNVQDKRIGILKFVVITPPSRRRRSCRVEIEHLGSSTIGTIKSFIRVINASRHVAQFAILPSFLPTTEVTPAIHGPSRSYNSIYDLFDLFPSPPTPTSPRIPTSSKPRVEKALSTRPETAQTRFSSTKRPNSSTRLSNLSVLSFAESSRDNLSDSLLSLDTAATSLPATPELTQVICPSSTNSINSTTSLDSRPSKRFKPVIVNGAVYECIRRKCYQSSSIVESLPAKVAPADILPLTKSPELTNVSLSAESQILHTCPPCLISHLPTNKESRAANFAESFEASLASLHAAYLAALAATSEVDPLEPVEVVSQNYDLDPELKYRLSLPDETFPANDDTTATWSESLQETLEEFRRAQVDDEDFRDLLYRDSSCYSKSCYSRSSFGSAYTSVAASPSMMCVLKRSLSGKTTSSRRWGSPKLAIMSLAEKARLRKQVCSDGPDDALEEYLETFAEHPERGIVGSVA
ncbi:hypothetical protein CPB83DRAFT_851590 [Crepidotus variabilis]|uniref:Uncharacterized protein n=1 Tax=Crepidotus variabilis TaxID=179855 RepID=A0A9P6EJA9_9AGAR|nr:hypothetical protein CPB83DRAFT_851590 [Crepidotus variabilis]